MVINYTVTLKVSSISNEIVFKIINLNFFIIIVYIFILILLSTPCLGIGRSVIECNRKIRKKRIRRAERKINSGNEVNSYNFLEYI